MKINNGELKVYHYTYPRACEEILFGLSRGLHPETFALFSPQPKKWVNNKDMWQELKNHMGYILLEINLDADSDKVFVSDRMHMAGFNTISPVGSVRMIPRCYAHDTVDEAAKAYENSMISLKDYTKNGHGAACFLPEVIVAEYIPLENISVALSQPVLEETLATNTFRIGNEPAKVHPLERRLERAQWTVARIPSLNDWFETYKTKMCA